MSRPFSYNDENFTVIGNILFLHVKYVGPLPKDTVLIVLPSEIFKRLSSYTISLYSSQTGFSGGVGSSYSNFYVNSNGKLISGSDVFAAQGNRYFYGFISLKDI